MRVETVTPTFVVQVAFGEGHPRDLFVDGCALPVQLPMPTTVEECFMPQLRNTLLVFANVLVLSAVLNVRSARAEARASDFDDRKTCAESMENVKFCCVGCENPGTVCSKDSDCTKKED
jgi:hypothetical protein